MERVYLANGAVSVSKLNVHLSGRTPYMENECEQTKRISSEEDKILWRLDGALYDA